MRLQGLALLQNRHALLLRYFCLRDEKVSSLAFLAHLRALRRIELRWADARKLEDLGPLV